MSEVNLRHRNGGLTTCLLFAYWQLGTFYCTFSMTVFVCCVEPEAAMIVTVY